MTGMANSSGSSGVSTPEPLEHGNRYCDRNVFGRAQVLQDLTFPTRTRDGALLNGEYSVTSGLRTLTGRPDRCALHDGARELNALTGQLTRRHPRCFHPPQPAAPSTWNSLL